MLCLGSPRWYRMWLALFGINMCCIALWVLPFFAFFLRFFASCFLTSQVAPPPPPVWLVWPMGHVGDTTDKCS